MILSPLSPWFIDKRFSETIQNEAQKQKGEFLGMLGAG